MVKIPLVGRNAVEGGTPQPLSRYTPWEGAKERSHTPGDPRGVGGFVGRLVPETRMQEILIFGFSFKFDISLHKWHP